MRAHVLRLRPWAGRRNRSRIVSGFLGLVLVESVLGGSGRFLVFGPFTLKMLLFGIAVVTSLAAVLYRRRVNRDALMWTLSFGSVVLLGALIGTLSGASASTIIDDVSPLMAFLALPFFFLTVRTPADVRFVSNVVQVSCIILAVATLMIFGGLWSGLIPFPVAYAATLSSAEVFWRGTNYSFFYKGFMYLAIGMGFFLSSSNPVRFLALALVVADALLSATRGLLLAMLAVYIVYSTSVRKNWMLTALQAVALVAAIYAFADDYGTVTGNRDESDAVRVVQASEVVQEMTLSSLLVGHGFGRGTASRPTRMELTYFEVFHKQGLVGLAFWAGVLATVVLLYRGACQAGQRQMAAPYLLGTVAVYAQSLTNPFLNNPIGITFVILSLASLRALTASVPASQAAARLPSFARRTLPARPHV